MQFLQGNGTSSVYSFSRPPLNRATTLRYFEFEVLTIGPMRVGWARADAIPGCQLGYDDCSWAFDGYKVG